MIPEVTRWLADFEKALSSSDMAALGGLFRPDAHWRDLVALTWRVRTVSGSSSLIKEITSHGHAAGARGFEIDPRRTPPRSVTRAGTNAIEAIFRFETDRVRGQGVLRLIPEGEVCKCWTLLTAVDEIKGFEESVGRRRPRGEAYSRDFGGPNWLDLRKQSIAYADRDPLVLVVAAGRPGSRSPRASGN